MNAEHPTRRGLAEEAAAWLETLDSADRQQRAHFLIWLKASPLHVHELLLAARVRDALQGVDPQRSMDVEELIRLGTSATNVRPLQNDFPAPPHPFRGNTRKKVAAFRWAAGLAALALMGWFGAAYLADRNLYATALGEQRMVKLSDGSVVFLNTETRIQVRYREASRDIYLDHGQSLFQVQSDAARPFRVHAASAIIQAVGTQFDVHLDANHATVAVVEGTVRISTRGASTNSTKPPVSQPAQLTAGETAVVATSGEIQPAHSIDPKVVTAWRQQRLIFHNTPLAQIVNEFNRYNSAPRLRVKDDAIAARRFDGSFHALRPESFLNYLTQEQGLAVSTAGDEAVIHSR